MHERSRPLSSITRAVSTLDRSLTLLPQQRSRKNNMATLNEYTSVLTTILSDIFDHSVTNFRPIYIAYCQPTKCQQQIRKNDRNNTLKQTKHQTKPQFVYKHTSHVTKVAGIEVFYDPEK